MSEVQWPAEWSQHRASWLAWPHNKEDWLGNVEPVCKTYAEFIAELIQISESKNLGRAVEEQIFELKNQLAH